MTREEKLIERITTCLEEFGMPKFQDRFPAMAVLQIVRDMGYGIDNGGINEEMK